MLDADIREMVNPLDMRQKICVESMNVSEGIGLIGDGPIQRRFLCVSKGALRIFLIPYKFSV